MTGAISPLPYSCVLIECIETIFLFVSFGKILVTIIFLAAPYVPNILGFSGTDRLKYYGSTVC
jgi:hypothetical protein